MTDLPSIDWANRWLGGFCAVGALGGLPVRGPDYVAHPPLGDVLTLPADASLSAATTPQAHAAWAAALEGATIVLLRSVTRARAVLLEAAGIGMGAMVGVPANVSRSLVEAIKRSGATPHFLPLTASLQLATDVPAGAAQHVIWAQPVCGLVTPAALPEMPLWIDAADSLPLSQAYLSEAQITLYGLHLSPDEREAGALLVCTDPSLAHRITTLVTTDDQPNSALALAQCERLLGTDGLAVRQQEKLHQVWVGLHEAAGLPLLPLPSGGALPHGVAVGIPDSCEVSTFYAYVQGEQTPVRWLPEVRPLHYAALRTPDTTSAQQIARWLLVPVGPAYTTEEISHAILGITKTADYLGVRWSSNPTRAQWYADLMVKWYGRDHDGYRPHVVGDQPSSPGA
ncbi:MAG: hypothetical protein GFH27_549287n201 [Chloroflexi bacterium AL-W]|nr:hypothetical protein [Chloroflexi bacterium AL-N1]NOK66475.1 hypothetical protein [Chloroflexi bacterium AL-N10]NOK71863.1 hypothetical protein [Chloroflexi bacterium AL-N5]NOK81120.1 hypothetical protein [Chloroflexi bacterium AL-W]NOK89393.1 hypothetical protein [Chloroflexi bacterium AL-N15]